MLRIGPVTLLSEEGEEPERSALQPPARRAALLEALATAPEVVLYTGTAASTPVRIASSEGLGHIPTAKRDALIALYLSGGTFELEGDFWGDLDDVRVYAGCFFDPASVPAFAPSPIPDLWLMDLQIRVPWAQGG